MSNTCTFFDGMKGDLVCDRETVDGEDVCSRHLLGESRVTADD
ncbi:hypothetical protein [Halomontanus rarus]